MIGDALKAAATKAMDAMMGSNPQPTTSLSRHTRRHLSVDESLDRVRLGPHRAASIETGAENITALKAELTMRKQEVEEDKAKYSKLRKKYNKMREGHTYQSEELKHYKTENNFLGNVVDEIVARSLSPYAEKHGIKLEQWTDDLVFMVLKRLDQDAQEVGTMRDQVRVLQKELFAKVDRVQAATDEQLAIEFRAIVSQIKTFSRTMRHIEVVNQVDVFGEGTLLEGVPMHHWRNRATKKCLVEAWVWSVLVDLVFRTPFAMFGAQCDNLDTVWQNMFSNQHCNEWPVPTILSEKWRYTTMEQMMGLISRDVLIKGKTTGVLSSHDPGVIEARETVMQIMKKALEKISTSPDLAQVQKIIDKAFAIVMQMSLQPYRLQVTYPKVGDRFHNEQMTAVRDPNGRDTEEGLVAYIVNPGLTKWGDTHGNHFNHRYDIVPALVQLEVFPTDQEMQHGGVEVIASER